jgi:hypothetical protein
VSSIRIVGSAMRLFIGVSGSLEVEECLSSCLGTCFFL